MRTAGQALLSWSHRPGGRLTLPALLIIVMALVTLGLGGLVVPSLPTSMSRAFTTLDTPFPESSAPGQPGSDPGAGLPGADPARPTPTATATAGPQGVAKPSDLAGWATPIAAKVGIPVPALQAYGFAELVTAGTEPGCQLRWTTLAGIGKIESGHGLNHATVAADGKVLPPIIGLPLDGLGGRKAIPDTDGGRLDLDRTWDHAVGPMQFIPSTWAKYGTDADGDGIADINDLNDVALSAARYLCAGNRNLSQAGDWWAAILSYNAVQTYAQDVYNAANDYGVRSR
jgi:hypothetical protein